MRKIVNGIEVDMMPAEEAARLAEDAAWEARHIPTLDEIDQDELNRILVAEGSVTRAIMELMLIEINKLRADHSRPPYTKAQFITALKAQMRTP